ncbi:MAG: hypothetical protein ACLFTY_04190 [Candidatus Aenigmatarchaeota archaeon]
MDEEVLPKIKKTVSSYVKDERGSISKHKLVALGAFLATLSATNFMSDVAAAASHTNGFDISWSSGTMYPEHSHHVSAVL